MITYALRPGASVRALAHETEDYLTFEEGLHCQVLRTESGEYIVQGNDRHGEITRWIGVNRSVTVRFTPLDNGPGLVTIKKEKQEMKYAVLAVGLLFFWIIAFTAMWGLLRQRLLLCRTRNFMRKSVEMRE